MTRTSPRPSRRTASPRPSRRTASPRPSRRTASPRPSRRTASSPRSSPRATRRTRTRVVAGGDRTRTSLPAEARGTATARTRTRATASRRRTTRRTAPARGWMDGPGDYSPTTAIGYGFNKFKDNAGAFLPLALVAIGTGVLISIIGSIVTGGDALFSYDSDGFQFSPLAGLFNILGQVAVTLVRRRRPDSGCLLRGGRPRGHPQLDVRALGQDPGAGRDAGDQRAHDHRLRAVRAARLRGHLPDLVRDVLHRRPRRGRRDRDQVELLVRLEERGAAGRSWPCCRSCASWPARSPAWSACWWPTPWSRSPRRTPIVGSRASRSLPDRSTSNDGPAPHAGCRAVGVRGPGDYWATPYRRSPASPRPGTM